MGSGELYNALMELAEKANIAKGLAELWNYLSNGDKLEFGKLIAIEAFLEAIEEQTKEVRLLVENQKDIFSHVTITVEEPSD